MRVPTPSLLSLPPAALSWSAASSLAAAISYADRSTSAIAASSLLEELKWTEGQLGEVQSAFFLGYGLTQVAGGLIAGRTDGQGSKVGLEMTEGVSVEDGLNNSLLGEVEVAADGVKGGRSTEGFRTVLPLSLFLTAMATLLFPVAATGGPGWAAANRFCLGLAEGLLLPAAMAGVASSVDALKESGGETAQADVKATASSLVIAGCYFGSAWAYFSAWFLYSEAFQLQLRGMGYGGSVWPLVFYVNGIGSIGCLLLFRKEFALDLFPYWNTDQNSEAEVRSNVWTETVNVARETVSSQSGRAILAAQIGQGALLYSIASYGPLYLEAAGAATVSATTNTIGRRINPSISVTASTASNAASLLILPQLTQAAVGLGIGAIADRLSDRIGTKLTRRALQFVGGVGPAIVLLYLTSTTHLSETGLLSPPALFGAAQTLSALSLGAVSVSHLDVAAPSRAGAVYALGNVAAAASGSFAVNLCGRLLESSASPRGGPAAADFAVPFAVVAFLSVAGSVVYGATIETDVVVGVKTPGEQIKRKNR